MNMTNHFSLPFCQLKLQILFESKSEEVKNGMVDAMFKTAVADVRASSRRWVDLVALMNDNMARQVCMPFFLWSFLMPIYLSVPAYSYFVILANINRFANEPKKGSCLLP